MPRPRRAELDPMIGERIRRRRLLKDWSIRFTAARAGISHTEMSRIERGLVSVDNRFLIADLAAALDCSVIDLIGGADTAELPADPGVARAVANVGKIRQALMETELAETPLRPVSRSLNRRLEQECELLMSLRHQCRYEAIGARVPHLLRDLHAYVHGRGKERTRALRLMVSAAFTAGGAVRYFGGAAELWLAAERCRDAAEALEDRVLIGLSGYERAHALSGSGAYARARVVAERAADELAGHLDEPGALEVYGQLLLTAGFTALGAGGQVADSLARVDEAREIAARTGDTTTLGLYFGPTNCDFWQVSMETDGGEPGRAVELAGGINPSGTGSRSRQIAFHTDLGRALAHLKQDEAAVRQFVAAERLAPERVHASPLVRETARAMLDRAKRSAGGAALRGLCERAGVAV
jgi:transcriptional regulator with XRE-family HTH domain